jgi:shikimate kinase
VDYARKGSRTRQFAGEVDRIVLTGFMGAGKSTVGQLLANDSGWEFLDLDAHIETTTGKRAQELFEDLGETEFRQLESELLSALLRRVHAIIAPGGAAIDMPVNRSIIAESDGSLIVFLDAPFQTLVDRCLRQEQEEGCVYRPLLHKRQIARRRYAERKLLYAKYAHRVFNVSGRTPEVIAQGIWREVLAMS